MTDNTIKIIVPNSFSGRRADLTIHTLIPDYSRAIIQKWIKKGFVLINNKKITSKEKLTGGESISIKIQVDEQSKYYNPENISLNIIHEDQDIIIINKPVDMVVHPAVGNWSGTLLNGILFHIPDNNRLPRGGIVHRLDKNTSGLMVVAKNEIAQLNLVKQLQSKKVYREYRAIVWGQVWKNNTINEPIGRHPTVRVKMAINHVNGKESITHYEVLERFGIHSYLRCRLETGRTHQIRVHMMHNLSPIVGDPTYGLKKIIPTKDMSDVLREATVNFPRQALHAISLGLIHPSTKKQMKWEIGLPEDMKGLLDLVRAESHTDEKEFKIDKSNFFVGRDDYLEEDLEFEDE